MSAPKRRNPSFAPALFGAALIAALGWFALQRRDAPAPAPTADATTATAATAAATQQQTLTTPTATAAATATATAAPVATAAHPDRLSPQGLPQLSREQPPEPKALKPQLTLEEKLELTKTHLGVMQTRADLLDKEIAALEAAGKKDEAAQKRVLLTRLQAHMERLRQAVAERREPQ